MTQSRNDDGIREPRRGSSVPKHSAAPPIGYGRFVGRVGGLAIALGVGAAIANNPAVALADTTHDGSTSTGTSTSSTTTTTTAATAADGTKSTHVRHEPATSGSADASKTPSSGSTAEADHQSAGATTSDGADTTGHSGVGRPRHAKEPANGDATASTETSTGGSSATGSAPSAPTGSDSTGSTTAQTAPASQASTPGLDSTTTPTGSKSKTAKEGLALDKNSAAQSAAPSDDTQPVSASVHDQPATSSQSTTSSPSSAAVPAATLATSKSVAAAAAVIAADVSPQATAPKALVAPSAVATFTNPITTILSNVANWIASSLASSNSPVAPPSAPTLLGILDYVRRQFQYSLFNAGPTTSYNASANVQTFYGVVSGDINPADADGDQLTLTVTGQPTKGAVVLNQDGSFTYTPTAQTALTGGTDTFQVTVDDRPGNPPHLNLLKLLSPNDGATTTTTVAVTVAPTSPLGTPDQIAEEALADQIVNSPQMQAAIAAEKAKWIATANHQFALVGGVDATNMALIDQAINETAHISALAVINSNPLDPHIVENELPPHSWYGEDSAGARGVFDNPDTTYRYIPVSSTSSYVLTGQFAGGVPQDVNFSAGQGGSTFANLNGKDLVVNPDGTFTITVDSSPTAPGQTNHLQIPPDSTTLGLTQITARNTVSDYGTQAPMSLSVQRVSGPPNTRPTLTLAQLSAASAGSFSRSVSAAYLGFIKQSTVDPVTGQLRQPNVWYQPTVTTGNQTLSTQAQVFSYFQLADNQAMVVTIHPNNAGYFIVPTTNDWETTTDYTYQQTSLNNKQAIANPDGSYTIVISPTDPGVANWVSTGVVTVNGQPTALNQGTILFRAQNFNPNNPVGPTISTQVVTLDQLSTALPSTTVYVTPAQRQAQLATRAADYNSRFAPGTLTLPAVDDQPANA